VILTAGIRHGPWFPCGPSSSSSLVRLDVVRGEEGRLILIESTESIVRDRVVDLALVLEDARDCTELQALRKLLLRWREEVRLANTRP